MGKFVKQKAIKNKNNKWYESEWNGKYPMYALGPSYVLSRYTIQQYIVDKIHKLNRYINEDASMGIWVEKYSNETKKAKRIHVPFFVTTAKVYRKKKQRAVAIHHVLYRQQYIYWENYKESVNSIIQ